ncbi:CpaF family protein [Parendozoicomonas haliclonae]|uniref:Putative conjugal transfer protein n=1 Tax=Parendozoicomonas haliclonae TaxID=1960125 RepID=A0A1X7AK67_9GAMM|nr:CpaF family protein [Parendozoicomonas haliclonae]SMA47540.1 putative conjugal transfer protein [Parendozoicomonas haliclonae]
MNRQSSTQSTSTPSQGAGGAAASAADNAVFQSLFLKIRSQIMEALDAETVVNLPPEVLTRQIRSAIDTLAEQESSRLPAHLRADFTRRLVDEITGLGPLQPLLDDPDIADIMVNGPDCVYVERGGRLEKTMVTFIDDRQLQTIARRIAVDAGRRVDESTPMCDARLPDGSRVNIAIPPVALDGAIISIRKFSVRAVGFKDLVGYESLSQAMARVLAISARCRLNIIISGGTGSGKTTLLNALSSQIAETERIITIEDAAELQLQQPHVVRMETRPAGTENTGAITARDLVINALRMRPDRIIIGECRGAEAFEMLQAMNTGHDGSMSTLHANTPRDALARMESMVMMAVPSLPVSAIRRNIASAVDLIVQVSRLHNGSRKVMSVCEVMGIEGDSIVLEEIFSFELLPQQSGQQELQGRFNCHGLLNRSVLTRKSLFFGMESVLAAIFDDQARTSGTGAG